MKIAYISGIKFGLKVLETILKNNWQVSVVFSYSDSRKKIYSDYASFDEITSKYKIKHVKVQNINDKENIELLNSIEPDVILVMGWSELLKDKIIRIPRIGVIGSHPTELPKYRGRAPIPWTILKGLKESAETFFWINEGTDEGDILDQRKFNINEDDDATSLYQRVTLLAKKMILEDLILLKNNKAPRIKQDNSKFIEYWQKRTPEDGKIDWNRPAKEIHALIRATTYPYPGAFSFFKNSKLIIWKASLLDEESTGTGKIVEITDKGVKIGAANGIVLLQKVSFNGSEEILAKEIFSKSDLGLTLG